MCEEDSTRLMLYITFPTRQSAIDTGSELVKKRLAAGVNIFGPGLSIYHWQGQIREEEEWYLLAQTRKALLEEIYRILEKSHPYEIPCATGWKIEGYAPFMNWINAECDQTNQH